MDLRQEKQEIIERERKRKEAEERAKNDVIRLREIEALEQEEQRKKQEEKKRLEEKKIIDKIEKGLSPIYLKIGRDFVEVSKWWFTADRQLVLCAEDKKGVLKFAHLENTHRDDTGAVFVEKYWLNAMK